MGTIIGLSIGAIVVASMAAFFVRAVQAGRAAKIAATTDSAAAAESLTEDVHNSGEAEDLFGNVLLWGRDPTGDWDTTWSQQVDEDGHEIYSRDDVVHLPENSDDLELEQPFAAFLVDIPHEVEVEDGEQAIEMAEAIFTAGVREESAQFENLATAAVVYRNITGCSLYYGEFQRTHCRQEATIFYFNLAYEEVIGVDYFKGEELPDLVAADRKTGPWEVTNKDLIEHWQDRLGIDPSTASPTK
ncbi:MAG: hypothetical protein LBR27_02755 [Bifidobacteriaceae bacterium]|nr:hypothetical protein [Bifidobacteriaceae bacterium]